MVNKFKDLFVKPKGGDLGNGATVPTGTPIIQTPVINPNLVSEDPELVSSLSSKFGSVFEKLDKPGPDFYEYFKGVQSMDGGDMKYTSMFNALKAVDSSGLISISTLSKDADEYIQGIQETASKVISKAKASIPKLEQDKVAKKTSLENEIARLEKELADKKTELSTSDKEFDVEISKSSRLVIAAERASTMLLDKISLVQSKLLTIK